MKKEKNLKLRYKTKKIKHSGKQQGKEKKRK